MPIRGRGIEERKWLVKWRRSRAWSNHESEGVSEVRTEVATTYGETLTIVAQLPLVDDSTSALPGYVGDPDASHFDTPLAEGADEVGP